MTSPFGEYDDLMNSVAKVSTFGLLSQSQKDLRLIVEMLKSYDLLPADAKDRLVGAITHFSDQVDAIALEETERLVRLRQERELGN